VLFVSGAEAASSKMTVKEALKVMRMGAAFLDLGDGERACKEYDRVLQVFPTWWMALTGRVRCGLLRKEKPKNLEILVQRAATYGAPAVEVRELMGRVLLSDGQLDRACQLALPVAAAGGDVAPLSLQSLFACAWRHGKLRELIKIYERIAKQPERKPRLVELRLCAEAGLLLRDAAATDRCLPVLLEKRPDPVLIVRYLRDLERRGRIEEARAWRQRWRAQINW
jgi:hypothetical protein